MPKSSQLVWLRCHVVLAKSWEFLGIPRFSELACHTADSKAGKI